MRTARLKRYRQNSFITSGILHKNPLLVLGLGLAFAVGGATSLKHGAALSISVYATLVPTVVTAALLPQKIPSYVKNIVLILISSITLILSSYPIGLISPSIFESLGLYFPIMAANSLIVSKCVQHGVVGKPWIAFLDASKSSIGYSLAIFLVAGIREYFGAGTLWGIAMKPLIVLPAVLLPFSGFIVVGFMAAFFRSFDKGLRKLIYIGNNTNKN